VIYVSGGSGSLSAGDGLWPILVQDMAAKALAFEEIWCCIECPPDKLPEPPI